MNNEIFWASFDDELDKIAAGWTRPGAQGLRLKRKMQVGLEKGKRAVKKAALPAAIAAGIGGAGLGGAAVGSQPNVAPRIQKTIEDIKDIPNQMRYSKERREGYQKWKKSKDEYDRQQNIRRWGTEEPPPGR